MTLWKRRHLDPLERGCRELVEGAQAFLEGRLVEVLDGRGVPVPTWAWTNVLAHGSLDQLRRVSVERRSGKSNVREWREGRANLACLMLEAAGRFGPMLRVQQDTVLVPLELILAAQPAPGISSPTDWVNQVEAMLGLHRNTPRAVYLDPKRQSGE